MAESFFATVETEVIMEADWPTREAARQAIFAYIETWYNRERRHSSLGYRSPVQYEREVFPRATSYAPHERGPSEREILQKHLPHFALQRTIGSERHDR